MQYECILCVSVSITSLINFSFSHTFFFFFFFDSNVINQFDLSVGRPWSLKFHNVKRHKHLIFHDVVRRTFDGSVESSRTTNRKTLLYTFFGVLHKKIIFSEFQFYYMKLQFSFSYVGGTHICSTFICSRVVSKTICATDGEKQAVSTLAQHKSFVFWRTWESGDYSPIFFFFMFLLRKNLEWNFSLMEFFPSCWRMRKVPDTPTHV